MIVVIDTDCLCSCKSNYHTITTIPTILLKFNVCCIYFYLYFFFWRFKSKYKIKKKNGGQQGDRLINGAREHRNRKSYQYIMNIVQNEKKKPMKFQERTYVVNLVIDKNSIHYVRETFHFELY